VKKVEKAILTKKLFSFKLHKSLAFVVFLWSKLLIIVESFVVETEE
jgi:hypothetical protein